MLRLLGIQNTAIRVLIAAALLGVGIATGRAVLTAIGALLLVWSAVSVVTGRRDADRERP